MKLLPIVILAVLQGLTEFLPVSSSGHLVLGQELFGMEDPAERMAIVIFLHLGSLAAILTYYFRDVRQLFQEKRGGLRLLILGTLPAVAAVLLLKLFGVSIEQIFGNVRLVGIALLVNGTFLWIAEKQSWGAGELRPWWKALVIGCAQVAGIIPGISRSGSTIGSALLLGVRATLAVRFSFLLGAIAIFGAGLLEARESLGGQVDLPLLPIGIGVAVSFLVSLGAIRVVAFLAEKKKLRWFGVYCWGMGIIAILASL